MIQLDFFQDEDTILRNEIFKVRESTEKVRKGLFSRHNELAKMYVDLEQRLNLLERCLCKSGKR